MFKKNSVHLKSTIFTFLPFVIMTVIAVFFLNETFAMLEQQNAAMLELQIQNLLDKTEEELALSISVANNMCVDSALSRKSVGQQGNQTLEGLSKLQEYKRQLDFSDKVYLAYPNRSLLTNEGTCSINTFINSDLHLAKESKERFWELMDSTEEFSGALLKRADGSNCLVFQAYFEKTKYIDEKRIGFVFDVALMREQLLSALSNIDSMSLVMWGNEVLIQENNLSQDLSESEIEELYLAAQNNQSIPGYSIIVCQAKRLDLSMHVILDNSVLRRELVQEEIKMLLVGGAVFLGLTVFIWLYGKYRYQLLHEIRQLAASKHPEIQGSFLNNDYEVIRLALAMDYDTIQKQRDNLEHFKEKAKDQLFLLLLSGSASEEINVIELMDNYDMSAEGPYYCVIHFQITGEGEYASALEKFSEVWAHCTMRYENRYILVLGISLKTRDDSHNRRIELIRGIERELAKEDYLCGCAACGLLYEDLAELHSSQQEAQLMMQQMDTKEEKNRNTIFFFDEFAHVTRRVPHNIANMLDEFKESLDKQNINETERLIDILTARRDKKTDMLTYVQYKIVQILMDFVYEKGESVEQIRELSKFVGAESREFDIMVKKLIKEKFSHTEKKTLDDALVVQYIFENAANQDLSVKSVADYFQISERTVNRIMKRATDKTYKEYINSLRLTRANELLVSTDMDVQVIAKKVGYYDISSFGKLYKQVYGITPTEYRDNARREDNVYRE